MESLQAFIFPTRSKKGVENLVADALFKRYALISVLGARLLGLEFMQDYYYEDSAFKEQLKNTP